MRLAKYMLATLIAVVPIILSCHIKSPYTNEEIVFNIPEQEVIRNLHKELKFEKVTFSAMSFYLSKGGQASTTNGKRIDLQVHITDPKTDKNELAFVQKFARHLKTYVKNIDHFNVITIDTKVQTKHPGWSEEHNKKTLLYAGTLLNFPVSNYFSNNADSK